MGITKGATRQSGTRVWLRFVWPFAFACSLISFMFLLIEALFVALFRGRCYVRWVRPSLCDDFNAWVTAEWRYYGRGGMQVGSRKFGLEVARKGYLSMRHPLI
jgi:hypothetical protein